MNLNELRELREIVMGEFTTDYGGGHVGLTPAGEKLVELIDAAIADQSRQVGDDDAAECIEWLDGEKQAHEIESTDADIIAEREGTDPEQIREIYNRLAKLAETAITALQAQIKPECEWCDTWIKRSDNCFKFCPDCGRELKGGE